MIYVCACTGIYNRKTGEGSIDRRSSIIAEIIRIAEEPTKGEMQESVEEAAVEYLDAFVLPEIEGV